MTANVPVDEFTNVWSFDFNMFYGSIITELKLGDYLKLKQLQDKRKEIARAKAVYNTHEDEPMTFCFEGESPFQTTRCKLNFMSSTLKYEMICIITKASLTSVENATRIIKRAEEIMEIATRVIKQHAVVVGVTIDSIFAILHQDADSKDICKEIMNSLPREYVVIAESYWMIIKFLKSDGSSFMGWKRFQPNMPYFFSKQDVEEEIANKYRRETRPTLLEES